MIPLTLALLLMPVTGFTSDILEGLEFKHGIAFFHELKYPADYTHLDYLNPDAPKGGMLVEATQKQLRYISSNGREGWSPRWVLV